MPAFCCCMILNVCRAPSHVGVHMLSFLFWHPAKISPFLGFLQQRKQRAVTECELAETHTHDIMTVVQGLLLKPKALLLMQCAPHLLQVGSAKI
jgi:hypothetical protein